MKLPGITLREFLADEEKRGNVMVIDDELSTDLEISAMASLMERSGKILGFNRIMNAPGYSLVTGLFSTEERMTRILGSENEDEFYRRWTAITGDGSSNELPVEKAVPNDMSIVDHPDLLSLPVLRHYRNDGKRTGNGRYITGGIVAARDPSDPERMNLSFTRIQVMAKGRYAFDAGSHGHLWSYLQQCRKTGTPLEMSVIIGAPPVHYLTAAAFMDDEYRRIGRLFNFSYYGGYRNDVPVPAESEIVIEARYLPGEEYDEGPFAEYTGYMGYDSTRSVAEVRSIIARKKPIYVDIMPSNSREHINLFSFTRSIRVNSVIRETSPKGHDIRIIWPNFGSRFLAIGYIDPPFPGLAKNVAISAMANDPLWNKVVIVNEGKTDLSIERMLLSLAETRNFSSTLTILRDLYVISSDPTAKADGTDSKLLAVTKGSNGPFRIEKHPESVAIYSARGKVLISHGESDADVNILIPEAIEASDMEKVGWTLALNMDCDRDLRMDDEHLIIDLRKDLHEIPEEDRDATSKASEVAMKYRVS
ncbi:UbiD family decarboxylase [Thermoplasma sp.]|uniref:UbiD family decarboxylase n=1 Tax=Thermoplasma sp. TaxID=1973142 RepID=UPI00126CF995|nr:UbiD family decarboxylase domain-containing protein [Thermoplasma sp.]KAA8922630.1 MAG: hypothetical protein F6Q11_04075 [Thermoplasma sp.]